MSCQQLSLAERQQIYVLRDKNCLGIQAIARVLHRSPSTISRELLHNQSNGRYLPETAQALAQTRRHNRKRPFAKVSLELVLLIKQHLAAFHSPEQLCGRLELEGKDFVSHELVY
ncbi:helix-turn-helix domain-containing protein [Gloeobacter violaceus]|uniref:Glr3222 protein n=1 Tax=Gloeobacter violaceus (strain ATCC 29082 / PCC 7421) TaxID=251221 RepID=Q7NGE9_GLOVI|nr:helix-turn-helix domain-containing protein [Gloeobacter violaceus]BAC91163.1 glr3222 [Gloeobacter violaceus PCC 7421]